MGFSGQKYRPERGISASGHGFGSRLGRWSISTPNRSRRSTPSPNFLDRTHASVGAHGQHPRPQEDPEPGGKGLQAPLKGQAVLPDAVGRQGLPHLEGVQHRGRGEHGQDTPLEGPGEGLHLLLGLEPEAQDEDPGGPLNQIGSGEGLYGRGLGGEVREGDLLPQVLKAVSR